MEWNNSDGSDERRAFLRHVDSLRSGIVRRKRILKIVHVVFWLVTFVVVLIALYGRRVQSLTDATRIKTTIFPVAKSEQLAVRTGAVALGGESSDDGSLLTHDVLNIDRDQHGRRNLRFPPYDIWDEFSLSNNWDVSWSDFKTAYPGVWLREISDQEFRLFPSDARFGGFRVYEARFRFEDGVLSDVYVSIFNKGDAHALMPRSSAYRYVSTMRDLVKDMGSDLQGPQQENLDGGKRIDRYYWTDTLPKAELSCGYSMRNGCEFAEFVNVHLYLEVRKCVPKTAEELKRNVCVSEGTVFIADVPMVDQGEKGYCVPATLERILRYLGYDADMHELALALDTDYHGGGGTTVNEVLSGVDHLMGMTSLRRSDCFETGVDDERMLDWYNQAARERGVPQIVVDPAVGTPDWSEIRQQMDPLVLDDCRAYDEHRLEMFAEGVCATVDSGLPAVWSVRKCFPDDGGPVSAGGHMRLIVGYDREQDEIIYSDSWGKGHERKRVNVRRAFQVTDFCTCLSPGVNSVRHE